MNGFSRSLTLPEFSFHPKWSPEGLGDSWDDELGRAAALPYRGIAGRAALCAAGWFSFGSRATPRFMGRTAAGKRKASFYARAS
jgi:hypothetical protein